MFVSIGSKKFISGKVSLKQERGIKTVEINRVFYEFLRTKDAYSLELMVAQIEILKEYEVALFENNGKTGLFCVFLSEPTRKTIFIENIFINQQIEKLSGFYNKIAFVNYKSSSKRSYYSENSELKNTIEEVNIENIPELIDPNKKNEKIKKYIVLTMISFMMIITLNTLSSIKNDDLNIEKSKLSNMEKTKDDFITKIRNKEKPFVPKKEEREKELSEIILNIKKGNI